MAIVTEKAKTAEYLIWEVKRQFSVDQLVIKQGEVLEAGQLLQDDAGENVAYAGGTVTGILYSEVDATDKALTRPVHVRYALVKREFVISLDAPGEAALKAMNILVRED
jgi:hypothetical protein